MLPDTLEEQLGVALAAERTKLERDEAAVFDGPSRTSALAGRTLYNVHLARAEKVRASGDVTAFESLYRDIGDEVSIPSVIIREAERRTLTGAVREVGGGIVADAGKLASETGQGWMTLLKLSPLVLVGILVMAVLVFTRRP